MPKQDNQFQSDDIADSRPRTVSKGVNFKTGEGIRSGPWSSTKEATDYYKQLVAEDYDDEL